MGDRITPAPVRLSCSRARREWLSGFYFSDDGDVLALRYDNWKVVFIEQRLPGTLGVWAEPFVRLRVPKVFNLRTNPYERADITPNTYLRRAPSACVSALRRLHRCE
jgi:hypothetical protein